MRERFAHLSYMNQGSAASVMVLLAAPLSDASRPECGCHGTTHTGISHALGASCGCHGASSRNLSAALELACRCQGTSHISYIFYISYTSISLYLLYLLYLYIFYISYTSISLYLLYLLYLYISISSISTPSIFNWISRDTLRTHRLGYHRLHSFVWMRTVLKMKTGHELQKSCENRYSAFIVYYNSLVFFFCFVHSILPVNHEKIINELRMSLL